MRLLGRHPSERSLALLASGDLGFVSKILARRHVANCPECAAAVARFRAVRAELASGHPVPPVDFAAMARTVRAATASEASAKRAPGWQRWWAPAAAGAAAATVLVAMLLTSPGGQDAGTVSAGGIDAPGDRPSPALALGELAEAQLTADGGLSVRSYDQVSGTLTITDYYAP